MVTLRSIIINTFMYNAKSLALKKINKHFAYAQKITSTKKKTFFYFYFVQFFQQQAEILNYQLPALIYSLPKSN